MKSIVWRSLCQALVVASASVLLGAGCTPTPKVVSVGGKKYKPKVGEFALIQQARRAKKANDTNAERAAWTTLTQRFPNSAFKSEAALRMGILEHKAGRHQSAIKQLQEALQMGIKPSERAEALAAMGRSHLALNQTAEALKALEHAYPGLPSDQQKGLLPELVTLSRKTNNVRAEIKWLTQQMPMLPASQQEAAKQRLMKMVEGRLSLTELQGLYDARGGKFAFPYDYIGYRLARVYCHSGERNECESTVKDLIGGLPDSHPLGESLRKMQARWQRLTAKPNHKVIGVIYPKSGRGSELGRWVAAAIKIAVQHNDPNRRIRLVYMDSGSVPEIGTRAVDTLVFKHRVSAIFGPVITTVAKAAARRAQELGVPMMTITPKGDLPKSGSFIFRNNFTLPQMGKALAYFAFKELGHTRHAVFYPDSTFGRQQVGSFWKELERHGGSVVSAESYAPRTVNFATHAQKLVGRQYLGYRPGWHKLWRKVRSMGRIKSYTQRRRLYKKLKNTFSGVLDFDAVFVPETYGQLRQIVSSLLQQDIEFKRHWSYWEKQTIEKYKKRKKTFKFIQLLGTNSMYNHDILRLPKVDREKYIGALFCARYFAESKRQIVRKFVGDFTTAYQSDFPMLKDGANPPIHLSAYTYDSVSLMLHIANTNKPKTRQAFRDALLATKGFPGVTGPLTVLPDGNIVAPVRIVLIHRRGEFRLFHQMKMLVH